MKKIKIFALFILSIIYISCKLNSTGEANINTESNVLKRQDPASETQPNVPSKVMKTLQFILENDKAPSGYVGGRKFTNREKRLPKNDENGNKINYQEWDVNPKVKGVNRGAERLITGSDNTAYFTNDHYKTFTKIKIP
jgi:ribonuclease T1